MNKLMWHHRLRFVLRQLGTLGVLGLALLIAAAFLWLALIQPAENGIQRLTSRIRIAQVQVKAAQQPGHVTELSDEEKIERFYRGFPAVTQVPDALKEIFSAAEKNHLSLDTGEYALVHPEKSRVARYRVALPLKGSFQDVLAFMNAVLKDMPSTALESANFKRDKVDDPLVDAKLVFLVLVGAQP
jgi:Tfp pilus assembly protein PilO